MSPGEIDDALAPIAEERLIPESRFRSLLKMGIILPLSLAAILALIFGWLFYDFSKTRADAINIRDSLFDARDMQTDCLDMETGIRGYLLSRTNDYLQPYNGGKRDLQRAYGELLQDLAEHPDLKNEAVEMKGHIDQWVDMAEAQVTLLPIKGNPAPADTAAAKSAFDRLRHSFSDFLSHDDAAYQKLNADITSKQIALSWGLVVALVLLGVFVAGMSTWLLRSLSHMYHRALVAHEEQLERVRQITDRYRLVTDNSVDLISVLDDEHRVTYASPSFGRILGSTPQDLMGQKLSDCVVEEDRDALDKQLSEMASSENRVVVARFSGKDGVTPHIELTLTTVAGNIVTVGRDVSERVEAERRYKQLNAELEQRVADRTAELEKANQELEQSGRELQHANEELAKANEELEESGRELQRANKELEAFSYSVSHDLRAPLRSIASFSMILQEDLEGKLDPDSEDNLARIRAAAAKMTSLIDALLRFSRIARAEISRSDVDVSSLVQSIVSDLEKRDQEREVEVEIQPELVDDADPQLLRAVLENLLENAWKFTSKSEHAKIQFGKSDGHYHLKDNGVGFEQEYVEKVFMPFERLHTEREFPGTGIGLATAKRIIDRHGGKIWAEGEPGQGATFNFTLHG